MFSLDDRDLKQYEKDLLQLRRHAFPFVTRQTLNAMAFEARGAWQGNIRESMTLRNKFTERGVLVDKAEGLDISRQQSTVGHRAPYMLGQEQGHTKIAKGSEGVPIATGYAAGQRGQAERTRLPRRPNTMKSIALAKRSRVKGTKRQRNLVAIKQAAGSGEKYVFLDLGRSRGIFKVVGGKRKPKINMVWDMSRRSVVIKRNPTMAPAVATTVKGAPVHYRKALVFQLRRLRTWGNQS
jgi:hypothetical protein